MKSAVPFEPGVWAAWRGLWLFTWKSRLTWRRLPMHLGLLLVLPALVWLTGSLRTRPERGSFFQDASAQFEGFSRSLQRKGGRLPPEQQERLQRIFQEEFAVAAQERNDPRAPVTDAAGQTAILRSCYERIGKRAESVLDRGQQAQLGAFARGQIRRSEQLPTEPPWNWSRLYFHWIINFYFFVILPLACVNASGALIRDELQADTLGFLVTRPVGRARLLLLKYLAQTAWLQIVLLLESALLLAVGAVQHIAGLGAFALLYLGTQVLAVFAWSALGAVLGLVSKRYLALALVYGLIVEMGIGSIPTNINTLSLTRHLKSLLVHDPGLAALYAEWSGQSVWLALGALPLAAAMFLGVAIALFALFEYHPTSEMQK
jgi:hypothetical protein